MKFKKFLAFFSCFFASNFEKTNFVLFCWTNTTLNLFKCFGNSLRMPPPSNDEPDVWKPTSRLLCRTDRRPDQITRVFLPQPSLDSIHWRWLNGGHLVDDKLKIDETRGNINMSTMSINQQFRNRSIRHSKWMTSDDSSMGKLLKGSIVWRSNDCCHLRLANTQATSCFICWKSHRFEAQKKCLANNFEKAQTRWVWSQRIRPEAVNAQRTINRYLTQICKQLRLCISRYGNEAGWLTGFVWQSWSSSSSPLLFPPSTQLISIKFNRNHDNAPN